MNLRKYFAYSKINLGLQVLNRRLDGYHNINTVFFNTKLSDILYFSENDSIEIISNPEFNFPIEENLIFKAGKKFLEFTGLNKAFTVRIEKNIPSGGGLGGGSSDAATTIIALNDLFSTNLSVEQMTAIANQIGSDCAFFVSGFKTAAGLGRGEIINPINFTLNYKIAIVNPGIHVSTPIAYKLLKRDFTEIIPVDFSKILLENSNSPHNYRESIFNDFEYTVFEIHPQISLIKDKLYDIGAEFALMSGSGSTVFGIFNKDFQYNDLKKAFPEYYCYLS